MSNPLLPESARTAGRWFIRVSAVALLVAFLAAAWIGVRGYLAMGHVHEARSLATRISANITDTELVTDLVKELQDETAAAHSLTSDPIWRAGQAVPYVGAQLSAVGESTATVDDMAAEALGPLVDVAGQFSVEDLQPKDGRIDTTALVQMRDVAGDSAARMNRATARIDAIDRRGLLSPLVDQVDELADELHRASGAVDGIHRGSVLLPAILGEDGPRNYLLMFQNNSEWRSLGGLTGAFAVLHTDDGRIEMSDHVSATDIDIDSPVLDLPDELLNIFSPNPAEYEQNVTQIPEFSWGARIAQAVWKKHTGTTVDGVIALDPVTLSYLLKATGPVTVSGKKVDADNAVSLLLNEVYLTLHYKEQDKFFQDTAEAVFDKMLDGGTNPRQLLEAFSKANGEGRLLVWSADEDEQAVLDGTRLQGALPVSDDTHAGFGVYVNDGTGSKLSYYMRVETGAAWCGNDRAVLRLTLRNEAPKDVSKLPDSITGAGYYGTAIGLTQNVAYLYLPTGAEVIGTNVTGDGPHVGFDRGTHDGRPVLTWPSRLEPGQSVTATVRVKTPWRPQLDVFTTPTIPGASTITTPACN